MLRTPQHLWHGDGSVSGLVNLYACPEHGCLMLSVGILQLLDAPPASCQFTQ